MTTSAESKVAFRDARESDLSALEGLVRELYETDVVTQAVGTKPNIRLTFAEFQKYPMKGRVIVICNGEDVIGYAIVVFFWSNEFNGDVVDIDELCVGSKHRGLGAGAKFFEYLDAEYPNNGMALQVSHTNPARALYERVGFKVAPDIHMWKMR